MTRIPESLEDLTKVVCMDRSDSRRHACRRRQAATLKLTNTVATAQKDPFGLFVLVEF